MPADGVLKHDSGMCRVGLKLLRGEWQEAVQLIMRGMPGEKEHIAKARNLYLDKGERQGPHEQMSHSQKPSNALLPKNLQAVVGVGCR